MTAVDGRWRAARWRALVLWAALGLVTVQACPRTTPAEVESKVASAAALIERLGVPAALPYLMDPDGEYRKGELYVFVMDRRGVLWANGAFAGGIGSDASGARDSAGRYFVKDMLRVARRRGRGWVEYEWIDPCTGELAHKQTFVQRVGDYIVGAGLYRALRA